MEVNSREADITAIFNKGLQAHNAGDLSAAEQLYQETLVIKPEHPEANHNIGVVLVAKDELDKALQFFKFALDNSPNVSLFWASYIDTLIKLERIGESKTLIKAVKQAGISCDRIEAISRQLNDLYQEPGAKDCQALDELIEQQKFDDAIKACQSLTETYPSSAVLNINLGKCYFELGQMEQAISSYEKATEYQPKWEMGFTLLGQIYSLQENVDQAIKAYKTAISLKPDCVDAHFNLGVTLRKQGNLEDAIEAYNKVLSIKPDNADAYNNMGNALQEQGKLEEAIEAYRKALALKPDYADAHYNMGITLKAQGELEEAIEAYNKALALKPDNADVYNNMGNALQEQGKLEEAIEACNKALVLKPDNAEAYNNMGVALQEQGKLEEAIEAYNKALALKPDYAEAHNNKGISLQDQGNLEEAIEVFNKVIAIKPDCAEACNNKGNTLQEQGKLEEAIEAYNKALTIKPDYAEAHRNLSIVNKYKPNDPQISEVDVLLKNSDLNNADRCHLHYTYAKMKGDLCEYSTAFENYIIGGAFRQKLLAYNIEQDQHLFAKIKNTAPQLKGFAINTSNETTAHIPIFILGMPRSGTTLVEQIVSSHSRVTGAGELNYVSQFGAGLMQGITAANAETISEFRKNYLTEITKRADGRGFVTDKMPQNFRFIALICAAFPEAKIIHVQRHAEATCWSNFTHYFTTKGLGYCYNLADTVNYYGLYLDIMHFWHQSYSNRIYNIDYDNLTEAQDPETRRLIEHLGLNWEDACLAPQNNKRPVKTSSQQQVRQKVYKGSSQAWHKYKEFLDGAFDQLKASPKLPPR